MAATFKAFPPHGPPRGRLVLPGPVSTPGGRTDIHLPWKEQPGHPTRAA